MATATVNPAGKAADPIGVIKECERRINKVLALLYTISRCKDETDLAALQASLEIAHDLLADTHSDLDDACHALERKVSA